MELSELKAILEGNPEASQLLKEFNDSRTPQQKEHAKKEIEAYIEICNMVSRMPNEQLLRLQPFLDSLQFAFQDEANETGIQFKKPSYEPSPEQKAFLEFVKRFERF